MCMLEQSLGSMFPAEWDGHMLPPVAFRRILRQVIGYAAEL